VELCSELFFDDDDDDDDDEHFGHLATFWFGTFAMLFRATRHVVGHEALENEWYVVIKAYKFTDIEILRNVTILSICATPTYRVY